MKPRLVAIGNALLDYFYFVSAPFTYSPPSMEHEILDVFLKNFSEEGVVVAGGCATNCARIFWALGGEALLVGCVGTDAESELYKKDLATAGVPHILYTRAGRTGKFIVVISETERSVFVNSGVASQFKIPYEKLVSITTQADIVHVDGFIGTDSENLEEIITNLGKIGKPFSFDAGGRKICMKNKELFKKIINKARYIFVNRDEYEALFDAPVEKSLEAVSQSIPGLLIVKRDAQGAVCFTQGNFIESPVRSIKPLDETGAGDSFAAGFLFGMLSGLSLPVSMRFGNAVASHVISIPGIKINNTYMQKIARLFITPV
ncbi:MAG TPA: carbohydrate kinase family protein [Spirochaetales bacterium]|nr:carbohydrate kinase family protein [Spirochaetales bacterium]HOT59892.1 carbohydrate kinase family protein [Spirochaetales bacterium]HPD80880.1 carbohydrate kinase family protein [Spirochaetales bacterium]HQK33543.1 carbohydrate kinase family protein [Spirochaetales bacterium]HRV27761.1 carbohydrate kinase family protein [Spirochaetia bacterium]